MKIGGICMEVLDFPIKMISYVDNKGDLCPLRFRYKTEDGSIQDIKVENIIDKSTEKLADGNMIIYKCQSLIGNTIKLFEIKHDAATYKWNVFEI